MENDMQLAALIESAIAEMTASPQSFKSVIESLQHDRPYLIESLLLEIWREHSRPTCRGEAPSESWKTFLWRLLANELDGKLNAIAATTAASQLL